MHSISPLPDIRTALVSIDIEVERGQNHGVVDPSRLPEAHAAARRYKAIAMRLLSESADHLHMAYDPGLSAKRGNSARYVIAADNGISRAVGEALGVEIAEGDIVVVIGPAFVEWQTTPEVLTEIVADDLTSALQFLKPLRCKGPIAKLMPYLVQIAGNIILQGAQEDEGPTKREERKDRAVGRAFNSIAAQDYDSDNAHGMVVTDNPAWLPLASIVADTAGDAAFSVDLPLNRDAAVQVIHHAIARAMRDADVPVTKSKAA